VIVHDRLYGTMKLTTGTIASARPSIAYIDNYVYPHIHVPGMCLIGNLLYLTCSHVDVEDTIRQARLGIWREPICVTFFDYLLSPNICVLLL
jgi:hypothetical protein